MRESVQERGQPRVELGAGHHAGRLLRPKEMPTPQRALTPALTLSRGVVGLPAGLREFLQSEPSAWLHSCVQEARLLFFSIFVNLAILLMLPVNANVQHGECNAPRIPVVARFRTLLCLHQFEGLVFKSFAFSPHPSPGPGSALHAAGAPFSACPWPWLLIITFSVFNIMVLVLSRAFS